MDMQPYQSRRKRVFEAMSNNSIAIFPSANSLFRNADAEHLFRQDSTFLYLTGFPEPHALCLLLKDTAGSEQSILFNQPKDSQAEQWTGTRCGQEQACHLYGFDSAFDSLHECDEKIPAYLINKTHLYFPFFFDEAFTQQIHEWMALAKSLQKKHQTLPHQLSDSRLMTDQLRLIKSQEEIQHLQHAAQVSAEAHTELMKQCKPKMQELELEAIFVAHALKNKCRAMAYPPIIASGNNACILHYTDNQATLTEGDLVLVDAGAESQGYAADITRTFPVGTQFTPPQKTLYQLVLEAQLAGIQAAAPEKSFESVQEAILMILVPGLVNLGLLAGSIKELIHTKAYKAFYMHNSGHWLGLDVHDVGPYYEQDTSIILKPGMVLTVEPGLYIPNDDPSIDEKWRGIGIRIEDDVLITETGNTVLSKAVPKDIEAIEQLRQVSATV